MGGLLAFTFGVGCLRYAEWWCGMMSEEVVMIGMSIGECRVYVSLPNISAVYITVTHTQPIAAFVMLKMSRARKPPPPTNDKIKYCIWNFFSIQRLISMQHLSRSNTRYFVSSVNRWNSQN